MSRRTGAFARAFVAWLSFGPLLAPAGIVVLLGGLRSPALAESKDYATWARVASPLSSQATPRTP